MCFTAHQATPLFNHNLLIPPTTQATSHAIGLVPTHSSIPHSPHLQTTLYTLHTQKQDTHAGMPVRVLYAIPCGCQIIHCLSYLHTAAIAWHHCMQHLPLYVSTGALLQHAILILRLSCSCTLPEYTHHVGSNINNHPRAPYIYVRPGSRCTHQSTR